MIREVAKELWEGSDINKPLPEFIAWLEAEAKEFGGEPYVFLRYECNEYASLSFELRRPETEAECAIREEREAASRQYYADRELAMYQALKAKYGGE